MNVEYGKKFLYIHTEEEEEVGRFLSYKGKNWIEIGGEKVETEPFSMFLTETKIPPVAVGTKKEILTSGAMPPFYTTEWYDIQDELRNMRHVPMNNYIYVASLKI